jgi:hypothetical protein
MNRPDFKALRRDSIDYADCPFAKAAALGLCRVIHEVKIAAIELVEARSERRLEGPLIFRCRV